MDVKQENLGSPKKKASPTKRKAGDADLDAREGEKYQKKAWTDEEERIFNELVKKVVMEHMWVAAKEDGRLAHRGSSGIKAHVKAILNKFSR